MNNAQFDKVQRAVFNNIVKTRRQEESKKGIQETNQQGTSDYIKELIRRRCEIKFEDHKPIITNVCTLTESVRNLINNHPTNVTRVWGSYWKTLRLNAGVQDTVITSRGKTARVKEKTHEIRHRLTFFEPNRFNHVFAMKVDIGSLLSEVHGDSFQHTTYLKGMEIETLGLEHYKLTTPFVELELRRFTAANEFCDRYYFYAVKMTTSSGTRVVYFDWNSKKASIDQIVLEMALQGYKFDPDEVNLWK